MFHFTDAFTQEIYSELKGIVFPNCV